MEEIKINYFEQELRRLIKQFPQTESATFAGRACYLDLGGDNRARLEFITTGHADHYSSLKVAVLNRTDGAVDTLLFRFGDVWGNRPTNNPNFRDGIIPHLWTSGRETEWYVYRPTDSDMKQLAAEVSGYLAVFTVRDLPLQKEPEKSTVAKMLKDAKQLPAKQKTTTSRKNKEPEI